MTGAFKKCKAGLQGGSKSSDNVINKSLFLCTKVLLFKRKQPLNI